MQGWRNHMEDAHIAELDLLNFKGGKKDINALFGVFDGHGGDTVSKFVSKYFVQELRKQQENSDNIEDSLTQAFTRMDRCILSPEGTQSTFNFLKNGSYDDQEQFNESQVDLKKAKEIINNYEKEYKNREKTSEELDMIEELEKLKEEIKKL